MKYLNYIFLSIILLFCTNLHAQNSQLKSAKLKVDSLFFANQVEALEISEKMLPLSYQENDTFHITYFLDQAGELNRKLGNYDRAIAQITECIDYKDNWEDLKDLSLSYNNLGKAYSNKGQYELAAKNFLEALRLMEVAKNEIGQGYYLNNLGALYDLQHNYSKAIEYYKKSLTIKHRLDDANGIAATNLNIGISYFNLGDFKKALNHYEKAIRIYRKQDAPTKLARVLSNHGKTNIQLKDYDAAKSSLLEAYSLRSVIDDAQLITNLTINISSFYLETNQVDSAFMYSSAAMKYAHEHNSFKQLKEVYAQRANLFHKTGQLDSAYAHLILSTVYEDSLINEANIYAVADMEAKYNYEKNLRVIKEKELQQAIDKKKLNEKKIQIIYLISIVTLITIGLVLVFILYQNKKRKNKLLQGQTALIKKRKTELESLNNRLEGELDTLQLSIEEKERLLENVFSKGASIELPPEILSLSKREMEVLSHLALGQSDEQIAQSLFISKSTAKTHLRRIYSKLLVNGRAEAVAIAHKYDLLGSIDQSSSAK